MKKLLHRGWFYRMKQWMTAVGLMFILAVGAKSLSLMDWNWIQERLDFPVSDSLLVSAVARLFRFQYPVYRRPPVTEQFQDERNMETAWLTELSFLGDPLYRLLSEERHMQRVRDPAYAEYRIGRKAYAKWEENPGYIRYAGEAGDITIYEGAGESERKAFSRGGVMVNGTSYRMEQLADYDFLMKEFFSVHSSTTASRDLMNAEAFMNQDFTLEKSQDGAPQILIYHTHSQEEYAGGGYVTGVGEYLAKLLQEKGYAVIHDTASYDLQGGKLDRSTAYNYALDGITAILERYPSIEVILDLHRDGVREDLHMSSKVNGKDTAPVMFFNGLSQTPDGPIDYLANPYREENLAFSFQMQLEAAARYPGWTRKIYLKGLRYNLHLRPRSALLEVGAQTNTYDEAMNAMEPLAEVLDKVLQGS